MKLIDADEAIARIDEKLNKMSTFTESEYGIMGYRNACVAFKQMLNSLPAINEWIPCCKAFDKEEKHSGWIPMSERPPEVGQYVLISTDVNFIATAVFQGDYWDSTFDLDWIEILAWMPSPEPYKEILNDSN